MELNEENLIAKIKSLRDEYMAEHNITAYDINNGLCDDFANDIIWTFGYTDDFYELCNHSFMVGKDGEETGLYNWDIELLKEHWSHVQPPEFLSLEELDDINFGLHVWIYYDGKHYDAECPEGVENFFELPLFKKHFRLYKQDIEISEVER